jgi:NADPH:quinone reductase-like Zn-dependent oxidoreductase
VLVALAQPPSQERAQSLGVRAEMVMTTGRGEVLSVIAAMVDAGRLQTAPCQAYPLSEAQQVHAQGEAGKLKGRTVLRVSGNL